MAKRTSRKRTSKEETRPQFAPLEITSYAALLRAEKEILKRIAKVRHGGNLFMAHPFLLLADVGARISEPLRQEILRMHPELSGLSEHPYRALRQTQEDQNVRFRMRGLFRARKR